MCSRHKPWENYVRVILVLVRVVTISCSNRTMNRLQMLYNGASESLRESSLLPKKSATV